MYMYNVSIPVFYALIAKNDTSILFTIWELTFHKYREKKHKIVRSRTKARIFQWLCFKNVLAEKIRAITMLHFCCWYMTIQPMAYSFQRKYFFFSVSRKLKIFVGVFFFFSIFVVIRKLPQSKDLYKNCFFSWKLLKLSN